MHCHHVVRPKVLNARSPEAKHCQTKSTKDTNAEYDRTRAGQRRQCYSQFYPNMSKPSIQPIFTVKLDKRDSRGFYTFGFIDETVHSSKLFWQAVIKDNGWWEGRSLIPAMVTRFAHHMLLSSPFGLYQNRAKHI